MDLLKQIYYGQFHSHLTYGCQIWGFNKSQLSQTEIQQNKALRIISFKDKHTNSDPLYKEHKILKLADLITLNNITFVHNTLNGKSPIHFKNYFEHEVPTHNYFTKKNPQSIYSIPVKLHHEYDSTIKNNCIQDWNKILKILTKPTYEDLWLQRQSYIELKKLLNRHFTNLY